LAAAVATVMVGLDYHWLVPGTSTIFTSSGTHPGCLWDPCNLLFNRYCGIFPQQ